MISGSEAFEFWSLAVFRHASARTIRRSESQSDIKTYPRRMSSPGAAKKPREGFDHVKMKSFGSAKHRKQSEKIKHTPKKPILSTHLTAHKEQLRSSMKNEHNGRKMGNGH